MRIPKLRKAHSALALKPDSRQQYTNTQHAIIGSQAAALASPTSILDAYGRPSIDSIALAAGKRDYTERESFEDDDDTAFSQVHASGESATRFPVSSSTLAAFQARADDAYSSFPSLSAYVHRVDAIVLYTVTVSVGLSSSRANIRRRRNYKVSNGINLESQQPTATEYIEKTA